MPIYEYQCEPCDYTFETLIRSISDVAHCPRCGTVNVVKLLSVPAMAHTGMAYPSSLSVGAESTRDHSIGCGRSQCGLGMCVGLE